MALNFKIYKHRNSDSLHLKLIGDFDGSSAAELINELKRDAKDVPKIIIHTSSLKKLYSFGPEVFNRNLLELKHQRARIRFTGEHAEQFTPKKRLHISTMNKEL